MSTNIYLSDDTIAANIAFGVDSKDINYDIIEKHQKQQTYMILLLMNCPTISNTYWREVSDYQADKNNELE